MYFSIPSLLAIAFGALLVQSAPVEDKRQIGNLQCNIARVEIVTDIAQMKKTVNTLATQVASDPTSAAAVSTAQAGISQAQGAIGKIALSIVTGKKASADDRDAVESGLNTVSSALTDITSTDSAVQANVQKAIDQLQQASAAGDSVLANCN